MSYPWQPGAWWQASDGNWYPPELHPNARAEAAPPAPAPALYAAPATQAAPATAAQAYVDPTLQTTAGDLAVAPSSQEWTPTTGQWVVVSQPQWHAPMQSPVAQPGGGWSADPFAPQFQMPPQSYVPPLGPMPIPQHVPYDQAPSDPVHAVPAPLGQEQRERSSNMRRAVLLCGLVILIGMLGVAGYFFARTSSATKVPHKPPSTSSTTAYSTPSGEYSVTFPVISHVQSKVNHTVKETWATNPSKTVGYVIGGFDPRAIDKQLPPNVTGALFAREVVDVLGTLTKLHTGTSKTTFGLGQLTSESAKPTSFQTLAAATLTGTASAPSAPFVPGAKGELKVTGLAFSAGTYVYVLFGVNASSGAMTAFTASFKSTATVSHYNLASTPNSTVTMAIHAAAGSGGKPAY